MKFQAAHVHPSKAALIVVDVQNDFCHPNGACAKRGNDVGAIPSMITKLKALIASARKEGVPVIFIQTFHEGATDSDAWTARSDGRSGEVCRTGSWGADFYEVSPLSMDIVVTKHRYSAFINTRLDSVLRTLKVETLIMTGVSTNVCVESTARHGYMLDYHIVFVKDACAAYSAKAHEMTLENISQFFGAVVETDQLLNTWNALEKQAAVPMSSST